MDAGRVLQRNRVANIGKLAVLENDKVQVFRELNKLRDQIGSEVGDDVDVGLGRRSDGSHCRLEHPLTLTMQQLAPTLLTTSSRSFDVVTSTETHRLLFFRSITSSSRFAAGLSWKRERSA